MTKFFCCIYIYKDRCVAGRVLHLTSDHKLNTIFMQKRFRRNESANSGKESEIFALDCVDFFAYARADRILCMAFCYTQDQECKRQGNVFHGSFLQVTIVLLR